MCNLYSLTRTQEAMRQLFGAYAYSDLAGNLQPGQIYPNGIAPVLRHGDAGFELAMARWGLPSPPAVLTTARDPGVTNMRNLNSPHWRPWLGPAHRCLVPFTAFAEPRPGGNAWFTTAGPAFFAGVLVRGWRSVRKVKDGETVDDLFAFLTCTPNAEVAAVHPKAMPVILTDPADWHAWMAGPPQTAHAMQRPLPDGTLQLLAGPV